MKEDQFQKQNNFYPVISLNSFISESTEIMRLNIQNAVDPFVYVYLSVYTFNTYLLFKFIMPKFSEE